MLTFMLGRPAAEELPSLVRGLADGATVWQPIADAHFASCTCGSAQRVTVEKMAELMQSNPPPSLLCLLVFPHALARGEAPAPVAEAAALTQRSPASLLRSLPHVPVGPEDVAPHGADAQLAPAAAAPPPAAVPLTPGTLRQHGSRQRRATSEPASHADAMRNSPLKRSSATDARHLSGAIGEDGDADAAAAGPGACFRAYRPRGSPPNVPFELRPMSLRAGSHVFVRLPGEDFLRVSTAAGTFGSMSGHPALANGSPVLAAGELEVDERGALLRWSNKSGTYRIPRAEASASGLSMEVFCAYEDVGGSAWTASGGTDGPPPLLRRPSAHDERGEGDSWRHSVGGATSGSQLVDVAEDLLGERSPDPQPRSPDRLRPRSPEPPPPAPAPPPPPPLPPLEGERAAAAAAAEPASLELQPPCPSPHEPASGTWTQDAKSQRSLDSHAPTVSAAKAASAAAPPLQPPHPLSPAQGRRGAAAADPHAPRPARRRWSGLCHGRTTDVIAQAEPAPRTQLAPQPAPRAQPRAGLFSRLAASAGRPRAPPAAVPLLESAGQGGPAGAAGVLQPSNGQWQLGRRVYPHRPDSEGQ